MATEYRYKEKDLILPALRCIEQRVTATTTDLIGDLTALLKPGGHDAQIIANRNDTYFSQKVRNLVSHRDTNGMAVWTDFTGGRYTLTQEGREFLDRNRTAVDLLFSSPLSPAQQAAVAEKVTSSKGRRSVLYDENVKVSEGGLAHKDSVTRQRSARLRQAALEHYARPDGSIPCAACGFDFRAKYGSLGEGFIEIHHEDPLFQYEDEGVEAFLPEAVKRVKPLCSNCHRMVHRDRKAPLTIDELKALMGL